MRREERWRRIGVQLNSFAVYATDSFWQKMSRAENEVLPFFVKLCIF
jgi:hypothetical protein